MDPIKTAMDMGLHPTVHTDCPVMPPDPLTSIWTAVTRKAKKRRCDRTDRALERI